MLKWAPDSKKINETLGGPLMRAYAKAPQYAYDPGLRREVLAQAPVPVESFDGFVPDDLEGALDRLAAVNRRRALWLSAGGAAASLILFALALWLRLRVVVPLVAIARRLRQLADDDIAIEAVPGGGRDDEIGELAREFNRMAERLMKYEEINIEKLIYEKKKSEAIVGTISDPILVADRDGNIVLMNELAENIFDISEEASSRHQFQKVLKNQELSKYVSQ